MPEKSSHSVKILRHCYISLWTVKIWVFILCSSWYLVITESSYADNLSRRIGRKDLQDLNSDDLVITLSNLPRTQCLFNWIQIRWEGTIFPFLTS